MPIAQIKQKNKSGRKHTRVCENKDEHKLKLKKIWQELNKSADFTDKIILGIILNA